MKVRDWKKEIEQQQERMLTCPFGSVEEGFIVDSHDIKIILGDTVDKGIYIDSYGYRFYSNIGKEFTVLFHKYQDTFEALLDKIKSRVDKIVEATSELLNLVIQEDVPELVLEKLAGGDVGSNPSELIQTIAKKKFEKLFEILQKAPCSYTTVTLVNDVASRQFNIEASVGGFCSMDWGHNFSCYRHGGSRTGNTQESMLLIGNYEKLEKEVKLFVESLKAADRVLNAH